MYKGLNQSEVASLLEQYGRNVLAEQKRKSVIFHFFQQLNNFLIYLLIAAATISIFIGDVIDAVLIITIIILNAFFGLYQEKKAENAVALLKNLSISRARVIREGKEIEIDSRYLVPGDIVYIEEGTKISADGILLKSLALEMNEAPLTGESLQIPKKIDDAVYMGTLVAKGRGYYKVRNTGPQTKFGQIATKLTSIIESKTPLQVKLSAVSRVIGILGLVSALTVFILSYLQGANSFSSFLLAVSLAVAVVPEGLPAVMTATLAIGVKKMAKKKAIIRKLSSIEALGSITLIATDKTGTLTTNQMRVKEIYNPTADRSEELLMLNSILCSTASLVEVRDKQWDVLGDPTEGALLYMAQEKGFEIDTNRRNWKVIEEKTFDPIVKRMSVIVSNKKDKFAFIKGAPETVHEILSEFPNETITKVVDKWTEQGLRVIAFAYVKNPKENLKSLEANKKYVFGSLVALHDPPRPEINESVKRALNAGISTVMITGDNPKTAEAIAIHAGIMKRGDMLLTGDQLEKYSDKELLRVLPKVKVFARTTPFDKHRIVSLYQNLGEIVAVTGDGINDVIALKQADVGVAMGQIGTDVARETSDMVITDDNFATIVHAIEEGRHIVRNLKNALKYLLTGNLLEATVIIGGFAFGVSNILIPIQILYINLISDGFPALALAFSPSDKRLMSEKPKKKLTLLTKFDLVYIFSIGMVISAAILISYFIIFRYTSVNFAKTATFSILTIVQAFIFADLWLSHKAITKAYKQLISIVFLVAFSTPFLTQLAIGKIGFLSRAFHIEIFTMNEYFLFIGLSLLISLGIGGAKKIIKIVKLN